MKINKIKHKNRKRVKTEDDPTVKFIGERRK